MKAKSNFSFRPATLADIDGLLALEKNVWKETGANREQLISRINIFPAGNIIALYNNEVVGYLSFEYINNVAKDKEFTWDFITDNGLINKSHKLNEQYMYGINISVHRKMSGQKLGFGLTLQAWINMILNNKKGIFIGSRIPGFSNYKKQYPDISAQAYIELKRGGKLRDPELRMYEKDGVCVIKLLPNYFPDPQSLNYGVLLYRKNPFYNWPFRKFWAWLIKKVPISFRENLSTAKKGDV